MKFKAFTLAEILIVLMVIGLIATMSVPSLLKGIYSAQWRTGFKKAYNVIKNMNASEKFGGSTINSSDTQAMMTIFDQMYSNINSSGFAKPFSLDEIASGGDVNRYNIYNSVKYILHGRTVEGDLDATGVSVSSPWIISQDNMAYCVVKGQNCMRISEINSSTTHEDALKNSCVAVVVDVNGLQNSPNMVQEQTFDADAKTPILTSDRFYIYIGSDGVTSGPTKYTLSGRLGADLN